MGNRSARDLRRLLCGTRIALHNRMRPFLPVLLVLCFPITSLAYKLKTDPTGTPVKLPSIQNTFRMPVTVPSGLDQKAVEEAIIKALGVWAEASGLALTTAPGDANATPGYNSKGENHNDIIFVEHGWQWDDNAVAVTLLTIDQTSHTILDADIIFNAAQHKFKTLPAESKPDDASLYDDFQNTLTHELGHAIGLAHSTLQDSVMYGQATRGEISKRALTADDVDGAQALYQSSSGSVEDNVKDLASRGCSTSAQTPPLLFALVLLVALAMSQERFQSLRSTLRRHLARSNSRNIQYRE